MRSALLRGREHHELGKVTAISEGLAAIALSKGGALKTYSHLDPNEDAAMFAFGEGGVLVAVADGHNGASGSERALETLIRRYAGRWLERDCPDVARDRWADSAASLFESVNDELTQQALREQLHTSNTTLSVALVRFPEELLLSASTGDSHVFCVERGPLVGDPSSGAPEVRANRGPDVVTDLGWGGRTGEEALLRTYYLGRPLPSTIPMQRVCATECRPLSDLRAVVLATDGLSEHGIGVSDPCGAILQASDKARKQKAELRPIEVTKSLVRTALDAQRGQRAGDNIAVASVWLDGLGPGP